MAYTTIDDPSAHFQVATWSGNNSNQAITNDGNSDLQPDLVWIKARNEASDHALLDSTRGLSARLHSNTNDQETSDSTATMSSFDSDGFTMTSANVANDANDTGVAWQWKANGGTTTTNDASATSIGSQDSVYQANTTSGFSIVTYGELGSGGTIAHGLGTTPHMIWVKSRDGSRNWCIYHHKNTSAPETDFLSFDQNVATQDATVWNDTAPTSTVFSVSGDGKVGTDEKYVAYCFAEIQGYSKFGGYTGNGDADGPFIYTGFKPVWVMIKETGATGSWHIFDNKRKVGNPSDSILYADLDNAEGTSQTGNPIDILSNGFKCRGSGNDTNLDTGTYVYMAFAEHPFVSSEGVPCTAR